MILTLLYINIKRLIDDAKTIDWAGGTGGTLTPFDGARNHIKTIQDLIKREIGIDCILTYELGYRFKFESAEDALLFQLRYVE